MKLDNGRFFELEAVRGASTAYVVMGHSVPLLGLPAALVMPFRVQEAVMVFFLLSGFVIRHIYDGDNRKYARTRLIRIYPIFIAGMILAWACASALAGVLQPPDWGAMFGNLAMLQDRPWAGGIVEPYYRNTPYWTISYEIAAYLLFPLVMSFRRPHLAAVTVAGAGFGLMLLYPFQGFRFVAFFLLWWTGAAFYDAWRGDRRPLVAALFCLAAATIILLAVNLQRGIVIEAGRMDESPMMELRCFAGGLIFSLLAILWARWNWAGLRWTIGPFAIVAPISYALYAVHYPLLRLVPIIPLPAWAATAAMVAVAVALAWWLEMRMQPWLRRRLRGRRGGSAPVSAAAGP